MEQRKVSKWALVSALLSALAALLLILSGYGYQWDWWGLGTAFWYMFPASVLLAVFGLSVSLFAFASQTDRRKELTAVGSVLAVAVIVFVGYWYFQAQQHPPIHDITTDVENPPQFKEVIPLRADATNEAEYGGEEVAQVQKEHYPGIQTLYLDLEYPEAFKQALQAAQEMTWEEIVTASEEEGRIEATDQLVWFGFKDDIVIRVDTATIEGRSKIDVRSASRIGQGDLGVNANRIRNYLEEVQE